ncbi:MAG TPA: N-acetyl-gamma-glutamyl-phosphate reductase [Candidatus Acidoferrales bacterium]|nr:N-acetyl-gamma-glutamyl-phosphate reductase [Candidatus Acidoferrales bacterium]
MKKITVSILGGSGYTGGELLRLLLQHPNVEVQQVTSERFAGNLVKTVHPNLRSFPIKFVSLKELKNSDVLFICLPHGKSFDMIQDLKKKAAVIIDLSADFRLNNADDYEKWYHFTHTQKQLLKQKVLGLPELYKDKLKTASLIATPGCMATASILALYPLVKNNLLNISEPIFIEAKTGSSGSGKSDSAASQHAERSGVMRSFKPTGHRHTAEIIQELTIKKTPEVHFSATGIEAVRGILATCQVILKDNISETDIWITYRAFAKDNPFIRIVKEQKGIYRYPEPKILTGTNMCEIGFEKEEGSNRLVVISAIDNLMKGAAGQAVQCLNIRKGWEETTGLATVGLHPV